MSAMFYICADALPVFIQERHIYLRETAHNAYRRISYVLANAAVSFPPLVVLALVYAVTTFFLVGLAGGGASFGFFALVVLSCLWTGTGFSLFLSAAVPHVMMAYTVVAAMLAYFLLFSGFYITRDRIPGYWIWFHYLSLVKYPYQAALQNEFSDATRCFTRGIQVFDGTPIGGMSEGVRTKVLGAISTTLDTNLTTTSCIVTGADVLARQGATDLGVAVRSGWQALVAYVNIGSYYLVGVPFGILLGWRFHLGVHGIWAGMIGGTTVQTLILAYLTIRCDWDQEALKASNRMRIMGRSK